MAKHKHCVRSVRIRSFSGPYFLTFGQNTERYGVYGIQIWTLFTQGNLVVGLLQNSLYFWKKRKFLKNHQISIIFWKKKDTSLTKSINILFQNVVFLLWSVWLNRLWKPLWRIGISFFLIRPKKEKNIYLRLPDRPC